MFWNLFVPMGGGGGVGFNPITAYVSFFLAKLASAVIGSNFQFLFMIYIRSKSGACCQSKPPLTSQEGVSFVN